MSAQVIGLSREESESMFSSRQRKVLEGNTIDSTFTPTDLKIDEIRFADIEKLQDRPLSKGMGGYTNVYNPRVGNKNVLLSEGNENRDISNTQFRYRHYVDEDEVVLLDIVRKPRKEETKQTEDNAASSTSSPSPPKRVSVARAFPRGGPRASIFFRGSDVRAAIASCGGLSPGTNEVIAELYRCLYYNYGVRHIYGIMVS